MFKSLKSHITYDIIAEKKKLLKPQIDTLRRYRPIRSTPIPKNQAKWPYGKRRSDLVRRV